MHSYYSNVPMKNKMSVKIAKVAVKIAKTTGDNIFKTRSDQRKGKSYIGLFSVAF